MKTLSLAAVVLAFGISSHASAQKQDAPYRIDLSFDVETKDLTIDYRRPGTSLCALDESNLVIAAATPSLIDDVDAGLISFDVISSEICLMALGDSKGSLVVPNYDGKAHALLIEGASYGYVVLDNKQARLVEKIAADPSEQARSTLPYTISFDYDSDSKNLVTDYRSVELTPSQCFYEAGNLKVAVQGTPTLTNPVNVGLISFDSNITTEPNPVCLTVFGHSGGSVTIDQWTEIPSLLLIDGLPYGYVSLNRATLAVELLPEFTSK